MLTYINLRQIKYKLSHAHLLPRLEATPDTKTIETSF
jgi:hypothetical protein